MTGIPARPPLVNPEVGLSEEASNGAGATVQLLRHLATEQLAANSSAAVGPSPNPWRTAPAGATHTPRT